LAAQAGSIDIAAAGLTQRNEALQRGGRVVLTLEKQGFADLTGFIARKSTVEKRGNELRALVQVWFGAVDFVYSDMDRNSRIPLEFLAKSSSTQYPLATYKQALEAEYLPRTLQDAKRDIIAADGRYSIARISDEVSKYLVSIGIARVAPPAPQPITVP
jgi:ABC-type nitrate/sulfonate/bicarbonate transport system substrate-binding protein